MLQKQKNISYAIILILLTGCNAQELQSAVQAASTAASTSTSSSSGSTTTGTSNGSSGTSSADSCSYTVSAVYSVYVSPLSNFFVRDAGAMETVTSSACDGISIGETKDVTINAITRNNNQIQIEDNLNLSSINVNGTDLSEASVSNCDGNYRVTQTLVSGTIDSFNNNLDITMNITYVNDGSCGEPEQEYPYPNPYSPYPNHNYWGW